MKALIIFGYVFVALSITGILIVIAKLLAAYYSHFIHHHHQKKQHLDTGL